MFPQWNLEQKMAPDIHGVSQTRGVRRHVPSPVLKRVLQPVRTIVFPIQTSQGEIVIVALQKNSSNADLKALLDSTGGLRILRDPDTGGHFVWPTDEAVHVGMAEDLDFPLRNSQHLQANSYRFDRGQFCLFPDAQIIRDIVGRQ